jgi:hypothetical protein
LNQKNVDMMLVTRQKLIEDKKDDPEEYDIVNGDEIAKMVIPSMEDETDDERVRQFVRAYYSTLPKEIMALCTFYFEHNFSGK